MSTNNLLQVVASNDLSDSDRRVSTEIRRLKKPSLWLTLHKDSERGLHNFTPALLDELRSVVENLERTNGVWHQYGDSADIGYIVLKSSDPEYFSVGGDLRYFRNCIAARDESSLMQYSDRCLDLLIDWSNLLKHKMTSVALVQGRALGGGFEMALSADYIIAEEHSSFGFPEILFGLFPCSGAMSLLTRRLGAVKAERMMTSSRIYSAKELHDMGLVDEVCRTGSGERAVEDYIAQHAARQKAYLKVQQSRIRNAPFNVEDAREIVKDWVDLAMQLSAEEFRALEMLIMMQEGQRRPQTDRMAA